MKFSYSLSKRFVFPNLAIQFLIIHSVSSLNITNEYLNHKCFLNQGIYNSGSEYEDSLNILFRKVRTDDYARTGFMHLTKGPASDSVTVMFQCRGDSYGSKCRTCADTAVAGFRKRCPRNKGGIIWYDQCFLWVSEIGESMSIKTNYKNIFSMYNPNNVRWGAKLFAKRAMDFFSELTLKVKKNTEAGSIIILYAAGEKKLGKNTLYAMVQCVSLTIDCKSCLAWSITKLFKNGDIREGGRVLGMNCDVRYEIYPFLRS
ncbi:putative cysteine-rich repeat secretory protein 35 [Brassica napus]|uniref:Gnk2-homologous domain-containing protein n=1 Tax=Brassica oleracea var. oleracea TaxID=109376 RepID=A0A0D3BSI1_BRAOL|nr:PREDICTED: putative cysteine-rich repeat secretory protein 35 [Brassica oleracea var. oleracea]XP_013752286.1 putative cysteine-rich repeat secretory protein 35 [Brassica napus]